MKKFLLSLVFSLFVITAFAEKMWFRTTQYAFAQIDPDSGRYTWDDWEDSKMKICIDLTNDVITIYSSVTQVYQVIDTYNDGDSYEDNSGGTNVKFFAEDQDGDKCDIRLRIEKNGNSQIYVDFSNVAWVYNVVKIE